MSDLKEIKHNFGAYLIAAFIIGFICSIFAVAGSFFHRIINGMFYGGMCVLTFGLFRYVIKIGTFDIFIYSHKKIFKYSKWAKDDPEEESNRPESYHDYRQSKNRNIDYKRPMITGGLFVFAAFILSVIDFIIFK